MAKFLNNWILALVLATLVCAGCKQSNSPVVKDVTQMTFAEVKVAADKGNPAAQFEIGKRFHDGKGILKDSSEAVEWWQKAAAQKFPTAEYNLGLLMRKVTALQKMSTKGSSCAARLRIPACRKQMTLWRCFIFWVPVCKKIIHKLSIGSKQALIKVVFRHNIISVCVFETAMEQQQIYLKLFYGFYEPQAMGLPTHKLNLASITWTLASLNSAFQMQSRIH